MIPLLLVASVALQDTTRLTLDRAVERALASYPTLAAARAQRDHVSAEVGEAKAGRLPRVNLDGSLLRYEQPNVVAPLHGLDPSNPPLFDRTLVQAGVSMNWTVLDFGNRASRVRAQRGLEGAADEVVSGAELQLTARTVGVYLRVLSMRSFLLAQDQRLTALASASSRTRQLLAEGKAARVDGLRVDAEAGRAQADRIASAAQLDVVEHELAQLTQIPYETIHAAVLPSLTLSDSAGADTSGSARTAMVTRARAGSAEIREQEQRVRAAAAGLSAARATWFPELRLAGAYINRGRWLADFDWEWLVGVALSYPLYTGGGRPSAIHRAAADDRAATELLRAAQLNVEQSIDRALASLRETHARVAALQTAVDQSAEVARIEQLSLDVGAGTQTDFLDAEADLLRARAGLIEAHHAEIAARVELARITGELSREWLARTVESGS